MYSRLLRIFYNQGNMSEYSIVSGYVIVLLIVEYPLTIKCV